jgi:hypothetical protein
MVLALFCVAHSSQYGQKGEFLEKFALGGVRFVT